MKTILMTLGLLIASSNAFAVAQAEYQCGPYRYFIFGPYYSTLSDLNGNQLGRWEEDQVEPTFHRGSKLYLKWDGKTYSCKHLGTTP